MIAYCVISLLCGGALAQRFKVYILIPATIVAILICWIFGIAAPYSWLASAILTATSLQIGYVLGLSGRSVIEKSLFAVKRQFTAEA